MAALSPIVILLVTGLLVGVARRRHPTDEAYPPTVAGVVALGTVVAIAACLRLWGYRLRAGGVVDADAFNLFLAILILGVLLVAIVATGSARLRPPGWAPADIPRLPLTAAALLLAVSTDHLVVILISVESAAWLAVFVPGRVGAHHRSFWTLCERGLPALLFAAGTAVFYGIAASGDLPSIESALVARGRTPSPVAAVALGLLLAGLGGRLAVVVNRIVSRRSGPVSLATAGFLIVSMTVAVLAIVLRVTGTIATLRGASSQLLWWLAVVAMSLGNLSALYQERFRRLLADAAIAQIGYLLIGILAGGVLGGAAVLFYSLGFATSMIGASVAAMGIVEPGRRPFIRSWSGLGWRYPWRGLSLSVFLLSLAGVPLTAVFYGRLGVFDTAIGEHEVSLVIFAALNGVFGLYYCGRVVMVLFMGTSGADLELPSLPMAPRLALLAMGLAVVGVGLYPEPWLQLAYRAALEMY